jgi:hypothetical protein
LGWRGRKLAFDRLNYGTSFECRKLHEHFSAFSILTAVVEVFLPGH